MPRELDVEEMVSESSPEIEQDAQASTSTQEEKAADAEPSTATDEVEKDVSSIVRDVVDARKTAEETPAPSAEGEEADQEVGVQKPNVDPDNENYTDVPFHKHKRFQELLHKAKTNESDATQMRQIRRFLDDNGVTNEEAGDILQVAALAKINPAEAWKRVRPWVQNLLVAAGEFTPPDLQQRVSAGEMTAEAAAELARARAAVAARDTQHQFERDQEERRRVEARHTAVQSAVTIWEAERRSKDPNFEAKLQPIVEKIAYFHATEGKPTDEAGARDQLERAYKAVNQQFRAVVAPVPPRKPAIKPVMGGQVASVKPTADSTLDIINQVTARRSAQ